LPNYCFRLSNNLGRIQKRFSDRMGQDLILLTITMDPAHDTPAEEKAKLAREAGAHEVILYSQADFEAETKRLTAGKGVDVVYDSVGKTTFEKGLNVLRPRGMMVLFGGSSGAVPPFDLVALSQKGSLYVTRPTLLHYIATREELVARSSAVFGMMAAGKLKLRIEHTYPLAEAPRAHRDLEGRKTTGKLLLIP
jgi:NADPH2:quinone reductase